MASFTKKAIRDSFVKLLNEKPLSQITIRDIVDDCGVNRNTFYYYYQDLPQLVESVVDEDAERIIRGHPTIDSLAVSYTHLDVYKRQPQLRPHRHCLRPVTCPGCRLRSAW